MAYYAPGTIIPSKLHLFQTQSTPREAFQFLDLPGEIRNKIYDLAFDACLTDIRMGNHRHFRGEIISRPRTELPIQPRKQNDSKPQPETRNPIDQQPGRKIPPSHSITDLKPVKQAPVLLQEQPRTARKKCCKQRWGKRGPGRMYHTVLPSSATTQDGNSADCHAPFRFLFSCRQIYHEALCLMYAKTVFRFSSTKTINRFLSVTPLRALQAIQGLEIFHATQAEPELTEHRKFKISADKKWFETCQQIRQKMTNLKKLCIELQLFDWPSQLLLREEWARPILLLRRNGLDRVDATLLHSAFSAERLNEAARNLEMAMMSNEGRIAKSAREKKLLDAKKKKPESKVRKVLVIKMDNIPKSKKVQKA